MGYRRKGLEPNQHGESNEKPYLSQDSKGYTLGARVYKKYIPPPMQKWDSKETYLHKNQSINKSSCSPQADPHERFGTNLFCFCDLRTL